jgi:hypothetical protein
MFRVSKSPDFEVWLSRIDRPFSFSTPFGGQDFALLLVVADPAVTSPERDAISTEIIASGCRYAVCTGHECSKWDDSIDYAFLCTSPDFSPPHERFVMTTWHDKEPLEDVVLFFRCGTAFEDFVPSRFLVSLVGGESETAGRVRSAIETYFGRSDERAG